MVFSKHESCAVLINTSSAINMFACQCYPHAYSTSPNTINGMLHLYTFYSTGKEGRNILRKITTEISIHNTFYATGLFDKDTVCEDKLFTTESGRNCCSAWICICCNCCNCVALSCCILIQRWYAT